MNDDIIKNVTLEKTENYNVVDYHMPLVPPKFRGNTAAGIVFGTVPGCLAIWMLQPPFGYVFLIGITCYPLAYILSGYIRIWRAKKSYTMAGLENSRGDYIGPVDLRGFLDKHSIDPEMEDEKSSSCTIGWSEKEGKYYGWSHRGQRGFAIGDLTFAGDSEIQSIEGARSSAVCFARRVS